MQASGLLVSGLSGGSPAKPGGLDGGSAFAAGAAEPAAGATERDVQRHAPWLCDDAACGGPGPNSASGVAKSGKFRREQQTGHSVFAATRLPLSDAADACGTARCGLGPTTGRSASPVPAAPWNAALTAGKNGSSPGRGPGAARGGASTASRGPPQSSQHLTMAQCRNPMSRHPAGGVRDLRSARRDHFPPGRPAVLCLPGPGHAPAGELQPVRGDPAGLLRSRDLRRMPRR